MNAIVYSIILVQLLVVAWLDLKTKKISNYWVLSNMVAAPLLYYFLPDYAFDWNLFLFPFGFIVMGFLFFLMGIMGAGDSKYLASLFLILPLEYHYSFFEKLLLSTMTVGSILLGWKLIKNFSRIRAFLLSQYWQGLKDVIKSKFSYAPVILLAWLMLRFLK